MLTFNFSTFLFETEALDEFSVIFGVADIVQLIFFSSSFAAPAGSREILFLFLITIPKAENTFNAS